MTLSHSSLSQSKKRDLESLMELTTSTGKEKRMQAFKEFLLQDCPLGTDLFVEDILEYAEAFSDANALLNMQMACKTMLAELKTGNSMSLIPLGTASLPNIHLSESPEEHPEDFAVSVLSFANGQVPRPKSRTCEEHGRTQDSKQSRL